jgi:enamine deaminase RidA (YjgF/YER057c/UK114 family)
MQDVVRARYYVPDVNDWPSISEVIADLIDPRMKVEIEVTAKKQT